jgi:hypothetical protein
MKCMKTLVETNVYLHDPQVRQRMLVHSALESSVVEGAFGLHDARAEEGDVHVARPKARRRLSRAATKTAVTGP